VMRKKNVASIPGCPMLDKRFLTETGGYGPTVQRSECI
jgi:hypothetical protein